MDYEKLYKEALERASKYYNANTNKGYREIFEDIFHEFKESEDERIRKELIERFNWELKGAEEQDSAGCSRQKDIAMFKRGIAWLEKQGEQKYNYNESPSKDMILAVWELGNIWKELTKGSSCTEYGTQLQYIQKHWNESVYYEKLQGEQKPTQKIKPFEAEHGKYYYCIKDYFCGGKKQASKGDVVQALRGLPIMGLKDASEYFLPVNNIQNHAWSEEDEKMLNEFIESLRYCNGNGYNKQIDWLKFIKDRVQPQLTQEWNEEDEEMYKEVLTDIIYAKNDLKTKGCLELSNRAMKAFNWFSKRHKSLRPQSKWKPSEEQLNEVKKAIRVTGTNGTVLLSLYNDLKNL